MKPDELCSELNELYCVHDGTQEHSILYAERGHCIDLDWGRAAAAAAAAQLIHLGRKRSSFHFE